MQGYDRDVSKFWIFVNLFFIICKFSILILLLFFEENQFDNFLGQDYGQSGDEYEDYEDDEDGEEYEEEEKDPRPTKEALAYLELRQRLKEQLRKKKSGSSLANSSNKKKKLPYDK